MNWSRTRPLARAAALLASAAAVACSTTPPAAQEPAGPGTAGGSVTAAAAQAQAAAQAAAQAQGLPPDAAGAPARLASTPRHAEWAMIPAGDGDSIRAWIVYPERSTPAPVILVVHEIYGLTAWMRGVADQLAADGFIAIAPDLLTALDVPAGPDGEPVRELATAAIRTLDVERYQRQLGAIAEWGMALPAASKAYGIVGFCWGGTASFTHAVMSPGVGAAVVYYGSSPRTEDLHRVRAPVLGLYAGDDARVNATVPAAEAEMQRLGRPFDVHFFEGAGHGFLRQQDGRDGANMAATRAAWPLTVRFFRDHLDAGA
jgi:carboxymethylenebutenolidase